MQQCVRKRLRVIFSDMVATVYAVAANMSGDRKPIMPESLHKIDAVVRLGAL